MLLSEEYKNRLKQLAGIIKENYDDFGDEGPQPGDAEYHYPKQQGMTPGIGEFNNIDWQVFHETLVANEEY